MNRILANTRTLYGPFTGIQRYTTELLARFGDRVDCLRPKRKPKGLQNLLWDQVWLPARRRDRLLWCPDSTGPFWVAQQVVTIHDIIPLDYPEWFTPQFVAINRLLLPRLARRVRRIITLTEHTRKRIVTRTGVPLERIVVIPNGVGKHFSPRPPAECQAAARSLGLPGGRYVLSIGTIEPRKNLSTLLQVWAGLLPELADDVWLVLAGEQGNPRIFKAMKPFASPSRVHWTGRVDDALLPALYSGAAAFVFLSLAEGFGLPPLEAMACGAPVVCSNATTLPEVVGDAALSVSPTDGRRVASALRQVLTDIEFAAGLRRAGLERASRFSWDETAKRTWQVLDEAAEGLVGKQRVG